MRKSVVVLSGESPARRSGLQNVALSQAYALQERGWEVSIFCRGERIDTSEVDGVRVHQFEYRSAGNPVLNYRRMRSACRNAWNHYYGDSSPDVLHGHDVATYLMLSSWLPSHVRRVFTIHDPLVYHQRMIGRLGGLALWKYPWLLRLERAIYRHSDRIHAISEYTLHRTEADLATKERIRIIPNWINTNRFVLPADRADVRRRLGIAEDERVIFTLRALEPRMGLANLISAFPAVADAVPASRLVIGGSGPLRPQLERLRDSLGSVRIDFKGFIPDEILPAWYQAADLVVIPSTDGEGFGLPILEAMACGTPVLGTPVCAIPEVLRDLVHRLCSGTAPSDLAEGMIRFFQREKAPDPAGERDFVLTHYSREYWVEQILGDYVN